MSANLHRVSLMLGAVFALGVAWPAPAIATVITSFNGATLDPNVFFDIPNPAEATITFDGVNGELDFVAFANVDMWNTRNSVPFAWTSKPVVNYGETWRAETQVRYNVPLQGRVGRIAGLTFYPGPDGTGGWFDGMEFHFGLDQWDSPNGVWVQGLGDNQPGDSANLYVEDGLDTDSVFLRAEVTELGDWDAYSFFYKVTEGDAWTQLGSLQASFEDSRVALFLKGYALDDPAPLNVSFTYFEVGAVAAVPEPTTSCMALAGLACGGFAVWRRRKRA